MRGEAVDPITSAIIAALAVFATEMVSASVKDPAPG